jgi:ribonuclease P protein subunit POP4
MQSPENLTRHELIGLMVTVAESTDPGLAGLSGRVVDESRNTILVDTGASEKRVPKLNSKFTFTLPDGRKVMVNGSILVSQPENRANRRIKGTRWKL